MNFTKIYPGYYSFKLGLCTGFVTKNPNGEWYADVTGGRFLNRIVHTGDDPVPTRERASQLAERFIRYATKDERLRWCVAPDAEQQPRNVARQWLERGATLLEDCPEDFTPDRTSWEKLAELYRSAYYVLREIAG
jgi:hypothetical protein